MADFMLRQQNCKVVTDSPVTCNAQTIYHLAFYGNFANPCTNKTLFHLHEFPPQSLTGKQILKETFKNIDITMNIIYAFDMICTLLSQKIGWNYNQYIIHEK